MASSHLDTQATGGRFDGVYGVMAGLEVIRVLNEHRFKRADRSTSSAGPTRKVADSCPRCSAPAPSPAPTSSTYALGRRDAEGRSVGEELDRIGYRGQRPARPFPVHAAFEAHIEQGPILERDGVTIGVVTGIQGLHWLDVVLTGVPCHAGPDAHGHAPRPLARGDSDHCRCHGARRSACALGPVHGGRCPVQAGRPQHRTRDAAHRDRHPPPGGCDP